MSLPSDNSKKNWAMMAEHDTLEDGTCIPLIGPEKGLPHSFYTEEEVESIFSIYSTHNKSMQEKDGRWIITGRK